ncbi:MAG: L,D-transpeptidase family protein [Actinobacteria bacterium]|nr:L,D-transpeptidase family protein [Actinomycetota bacterium]
MLVVGALTGALLAASFPAAAAPWPVTADMTHPVDTLGLYDPATATWYLQDSVGRTSAFEFGDPGSVPVMGDWDGDGFDSPGFYDPATGDLVRVDDPAAGAWMVSALPAGGIPVAGDADGDGRDEVAVFMDGTVTGAWEGTTGLPAAADDVLATDLDGDGSDDLVLLAEGSWWTGGRAVELPLIDPADRAVLGDWDGDGSATLAVFRPRNAEFWLYWGSEVAGGITILPIGSSRMLPVAGRFGMPHGDPAVLPRIIDIPPLASGDAGQAVARLQTELAARNLYSGSVDGIYGPATEYAVMAFHKALGRERTWDWKPGDTDLLLEFEPTGYPIRWDEPDRIEVDVGRQIMFLILDQEVAAILPVSTGGGYTYYSERAHRNVSANTPRGDFELLRYSPGKSCDPLYGWCIFDAWNFTQVYAIHGYGSVPAYPASHGCVRIPLWESARLESLFFVGMPVHVWDVMPEVPLPTFDQTVPGPARAGKTGSAGAYWL